MPFIRITTNKSLSLKDKTDLKTGLGQLITTLHKTEDWLMIAFDNIESDSMYFKGSNEYNAIVEISVYGTISKNDFDPMTRKTTDLLSRTIKIDPDRIYINYREVDYWGLGGSNF